MVQLHQTKSGVYYIYNYAPYRKFYRRSEDEIAISKKI